MESVRKELELLYDQCGDQFYHCALAVTRSGAAAEDAVHNAFQRALQLTYTPVNLKAYIFRSVRNAAIDLLRKESRTVALTTEMIFELPALQITTLERREFLEDFANALNILSSDEQETVVQHLVAHLTFQEIADVRGRPLGTVTSWYRRGLEKLKHQLKNEHGSLRA